MQDPSGRLLRIVVVGCFQKSYFTEIFGWFVRPIDFRPEVIEE